MTEYYRALLPGGVDPRSSLEAALREQWTRDIVVTEVKGRDRYRRDFEIRITRNDMILDGKTGGRTFVLSVGEPAGAMSAELSPKGWSVQGPTKQKFFSEFQRVNLGAVQRSENVVLEVAHDKI